MIDIYIHSSVKNRLGNDGELNTKLVSTPSGVVVDINNDLWKYRDISNNVYINFAVFTSLSIEIKSGLKTVLAWYLQNSSSSHLRNSFDRLKDFLLFLSQNNTKYIEHINHIDLLNYKASLNEKNYWFMSVIAGGLKKWHALAGDAVTPSAISLLNKLRFKGNRKGEAVRTLNVDDGPLSDFEFKSLMTSLHQNYAARILSKREYLLALIFVLLGLRPVQAAALKVCDLKVIKNELNGVEYVLNVPLAKQRNKLIRSSFRARVLIPEFGEYLADYVNEINSKFIDTFDDVNNAPMFPQTAIAEPPPPGFALHFSAASLSSLVRNVFNTLDLVSERTNKNFRINPLRLRRTLGTRAGLEGHGALVIAELLFQSDIQNVMVYTQVGIKTIERISKSMSLQLAPMARAYCGELIRDERDSKRGHDPASIIVHPHLDTSKAANGSCESCAFCNKRRPKGCYTCLSFNPWLDGPHEEYLEMLLDERDELMKSSSTWIADVDWELILAVAQVVKRCMLQRALVEK